MILTMDVGNTNIKVALFDGPEMKKYWRMSTSKSYTSDEIGFLLTGLFAHEGYSPDDVEGIVMSSVVPTINYTLEHMCKNYFGKTPMMVAPGIKTGINLKYENPRELGSDRIANAVAAQAEYGGPCIFIDFGTATTFGAIDDQGSFLGGCICPGLKLTSEALVSGKPYEELAEGCYTVEALMLLKEKYGVDMPISAAVHNVIYGGACARDEINGLFMRSLKKEF